MAHTFYSVFTWFLLSSFDYCPNILLVLNSSEKILNDGCFVMTLTILSRDSADWWLMDFILYIPRSCLSSFNSSPEQVPTWHDDTVTRWHGQSCPEIQPTDGSRNYAWACSTLVLNTWQYFTGPRQFRKNLKRSLFRDDTDNVVPRLGQLMAHRFDFGSTMILPELVRLLSWTSANILPAPDSSGKISSQGCLAATRTILSQDSAYWWQPAFCCELASISTNANYFLSQSLTVAWLIFGSSSTPNLSLATGPVLSRDFLYAWASPEYRDSLTSAGLRLRRLSKIGIRLAFLHGESHFRIQVPPVLAISSESIVLYLCFYVLQEHTRTPPLLQRIPRFSPESSPLIWDQLLLRY